MPLYPPATIGSRLGDVDTPALVIELDAFERNLKRMQESLAGTKLSLRPHAKTHKCAQIALKQIALGAVGICCQKTSEAEALVEAGVGDILIANEVVGAAKLTRLAALSKQARIAVCADNAENIRALDAAARDYDTKLTVLVEVNVGSNRCGVAPGEPALALAKQIAGSANLTFGGLQAYQGSAQHVRKVEDRRAAIEKAAADVKRTRDMLEGSGIRCPKVTGAGTGTYLFEAASGVYDELQAGSYIFMDADYARNEWTESGIPRFEHSLFVWTTVMSRSTEERAIVDAGLKASSVDSGMPRIAHGGPAEYIKASDEHGVIRLNGASGFDVGDKVKLIPGHCDPTVNLYDHFICIRHERVEAIWPVTARGAVW